MGDNKILEEGGLPEHGAVCYDKDAMTNLYPESDMILKGNHLFNDTRVEKPFIFTDKYGNKTKFPCNKQGLYVKEPTTTIDC